MVVLIIKGGTPRTPPDQGIEALNRRESRRFPLRAEQSARPPKDKTSHSRKDPGPGLVRAGGGQDTNAAGHETSPAQEGQNASGLLGGSGLFQPPAGFGVLQGIDQFLEL